MFEVFFHFFFDFRHFFLRICKPLKRKDLIEPSKWHHFFSIFGSQALTEQKKTLLLPHAWRNGRAVECGGLENRCTREGTGGSNPSFSARRKAQAFLPTILERCRSGRTGRSRKPLTRLPGSEGSNPSLSAKANRLFFNRFFYFR